MSFSSGTVIAGWSSVGKEGIDKDSVTWSTDQESWIISVYVIGALIAALPAGSLSQKYGRKTFLLWLALPMTVGWIICLLGTKIVSVYVTVKLKTQHLCLHLQLHDKPNIYLYNFNNDYNLMKMGPIIEVIYFLAFLFH